MGELRQQRHGAQGGDAAVRGQQQLVNSDRLPTRIIRGSRADFEALGFRFGEPDPKDPLFCAAQLPAGWKREASDHPMWSHIVDVLGRRRVDVFYKAAFYDRDAFMSLISPYAYVREVLAHNAHLVLDGSWLTPAVAVAELVKIRDDRYSSREESAQAEAYCARIVAGSEAD
jgi:hypothetical protein